MQPHTGTASGTNFDRDEISPVSSGDFYRSDDPEPPGGCCSDKAASVEVHVSEPGSISFLPAAGLPDLLKKQVSSEDSESDSTLNHDFPVSLRALSFIKRYYPGVSVDDWNDWHWQVRNRIRSAEQLSRFIELTSDEYRSVELRTANLPIAITPHYLSL